MAKTQSHSTRKAVARKSAKTTRAATTSKGKVGKDATKRTPVAKKMKPKNPQPATSKKARTTAGSKSAKSRQIVTVDRRRSDDRRNSDDRRKQQQQPAAVERRKIERRVKVNRRRQIDPTTCERDYTTEELEFMSALDEYKRTSGRMFPTCSEILEVITGLGYQKMTPADPNTLTATGA